MKEKLPNISVQREFHCPEVIAVIRGKSAIWTLLEDTRNKAKVEKKIPIIALRQKGGKGYLLVIRPEDLHKISKIQLESVEVDE